MLLDISLKNALRDKVEQESTVTRTSLRKYGTKLRTVRSPYGYDVASIDRRLRELTEDGSITPLDRQGKMVIDSSSYIFCYCKTLA